MMILYHLSMNHGLLNTTILYLVAFHCSYHHNAYFAQQVGVVVRSEDPEKFKEYIQLVFDNQDSESLHGITRCKA